MPILYQSIDLPFIYNIPSLFHSNTYPN